MYYTLLSLLCAMLESDDVFIGYSDAAERLLRLSTMALATDVDRGGCRVLRTTSQ